MTGLSRRGDPYIWLTGSALGVSLLLIGGLVAVILVNGLGFFWPRPLVRLTLGDGRVVAGEQVGRQVIPTPGEAGREPAHRVQIKVGNRDLLGHDFEWIDESQVAAREWPSDLFLVERREYGVLIGTPVRLVEGERIVAAGAGEVGAALGALVAKARRDRGAITAVEKGEIGAINGRIERLRLDRRRIEFDAQAGRRSPEPGRLAAIERAASAAEAEYKVVQARLEGMYASATSTSVVFAAPGGGEKTVRAVDLFRAYPANRLTVLDRASIYASRLWDFIWEDPREANTEGGIFPAIFGTVLLVVLMSLVAVPFGVIAALYLREYAKQGFFVGLVRIAVNNLAGVPSIVFGIFGLGFFVYFVGGRIDRWLFPERLPTPTFGTGGLLWASLTLALLTVPVVVVAAEEALAAVPRSMREASYAAGATKLQTIWNIVLPAAAPGILTGLILAMARAAGEVAPLMITGVVKLAPELALDGVFPFFHPERKFMHLGFHIYDVGFQSPNVEAAKPMVYMTTILLLLIVVALNLTAILVRNRLRKTYRTGAF